MLKNLVASRLLLSLVFISSSQSFALTPSQVYDKVKDSVIVVKTFDQNGFLKSSGSGVIIEKNKVGTNRHVIEGGAFFKVGREDRFVSATLFAEEPDKDICVLTSPDISGKVAEIGKSSNLKVGDTVYAIGAPQGLELSLSNGIVSQLRFGPPPLIQTTAAISPGSSGGGLFDENGLLVGLTTLYIQGSQSLNFAIPSEWLSDIKPAQRSMNTKTETDWKKRYIALYEQKDWDKLIELLKKWTEAEPFNSEPWECTGFIMMVNTRYNEAFIAYQKALAISKDNANTWFNLAAIYDVYSDYDDEIKCLKESVRIKPDMTIAWSRLGDTCARMGHYKEAAKNYETAVKKDPGDRQTWYKMGALYKTNAEHEDAIRCFRKIVQIKSDDKVACIAYLEMGASYQSLGKHTSAIEAIRHATTIDPDNDLFKKTLGLAYAQQGQYCVESREFKKGVDAYSRAIKIDPQNALYKKMLSSAYFHLGEEYKDSVQYEEAIQAFLSATKYDPNSSSAWGLLGMCYLEIGKKEEALDTVSKLRTLDPNSAARLQYLCSQYR